LLLLILVEHARADSIGFACGGKLGSLRKTELGAHQLFEDSMLERFLRSASAVGAKSLQIFKTKPCTP
jgi:hypothetical protein